ncbi:MAG TPA: aminotransferase [Planctomycetes bacterium]|nr:aminotransferase [Planctomycetota bacterium]HIL36948.1 aminotransferase [Planctomycetota bacterium]
MTHKALFKTTLALQGERLHFAAHSHHMWPDRVIEAHGEAALLAARLLDRKWDKLFGELLPRLSERVARRLGWPDPSGLVFGANTHEFLVRLCSTLPRDRPWRILTSDAEFYAALRQFSSWQENGVALIEQVPAEPLATFSERMVEAIGRGGHDLVMFSKVFFNSGWIVDDVDALVAAVPDPQTLVLIDAYHGFNALPMDYSRVAKRAFVTAGGYKYAMAGEGACFLACPPGICPRPVQTGWLASFGSLASFDVEGKLAYGADGSRFAGATLDPTGLMRLDAALGLLDKEGLDPKALHAWVGALQNRVIEALPESGPMSRASLFPGPEVPDRGHFLCFKEAKAGQLKQGLDSLGVQTDVRRDRLRLGFSLYHDQADVDRLLELLAQARASIS